MGEWRRWPVTTPAPLGPGVPQCHTDTSFPSAARVPSILNQSEKERRGRGGPSYPTRGDRQARGVGEGGGGRWKEGGVGALVREIGSRDKKPITISV